MSLLRSGAYTLIASVVQIVLGLVGVTIIARALGPDGKGIYDLYLTGASLAALTLSFALPAGVTYVVALGGARLRPLAAQLLLITVFIAGVTTFITVFASQLSWTHAFLPGDVWLSVAVGLTAGATAGYGLFRSVLIGQRAFKQASVADVLRSVTVLVALAVAALLASRNHEGRATLVAWGNTSAIVLAVAIYAFTTRLRPTWVGAGETRELRSAAEYSAPSYVGNLLQFLNYRVDVFLVSGYLGAGAVGRYQVAVMLAELLRVLPAAAQAVIWPTIASDQLSKARNASLAARTARSVLSVTVAAALAIGAIGGPLIPGIFGSEFWPAVPALVILLPGLVFFAVTTVLAGYIAGMGRPGLNLQASAVGFAVTLGLDFMIIPRWGIRGAAAASTVSYAVSTAYTIAVFSKLTGCRVREVLLPERVDLALAKELWSRLTRSDADTRGYKGADESSVSVE